MNDQKATNMGSIAGAASRAGEAGANLTAGLGGFNWGKNMELKYVRHSKIGFVLWPRTDDLWHLHIGSLLLKQAGGEIVSAGFAKLSGGRAKCWGMSESLGIPSKPDDSAALAAQLSGAG